GHTGLRPNDELQKELSAARLFPLQVRLEGSRLIVLFNDSSTDQTIRPGMEVLEINGHKIDDLVKLILPKLPRDGDIETGRRMRFQENLGQNYWLSREQTSQFTIKARDDNGKTVSAKLVGVTNEERKNIQNPVNAELKASL